MLALILATVLFQLPPQESDAVIGVTAIHIESGRKVSVRGDERFPMGSVYKFPIGLTVLHAVDEGRLSLDRKVTVQPEDFALGWSPLREEAKGKAVEKSVADLLERMVSMSDNTACDVLLALAGGPEAVTRRMKELGLPQIRIDRSEKQIHRDLQSKDGLVRYATDARDTATPEAMADLLVKFWNGHDQLTSGSHAIILGHLTTSPTGPKKLRAGVPKGWSVAHKSGLMPGVSNDVGILTSPDGRQHIAIAVFTKAASGGYEAADPDVARVTAAVVKALAR